MSASTSAKLLGLLAAISLATVGVRAQTTVGSALANFAKNAANYNIVALGATATTTISTGQDVEGGLAIRGNLSITGDNLMSQNSNFSTGTKPSLYVAGNLTVNGSAKLEYGTAVIGNASSFTYTSQKDLVTNGGSSGSGDISFANDPSAAAPTSTTPTGWNWNTLASDFQTDSTTFANATANGTSVVAGNISMQGQTLTFGVAQGTKVADHSTIIITLDASKLGNQSYNGQTAGNVTVAKTELDSSGNTVDLPSDINYVINVINTSSNNNLFQNMNFNTTGLDNSILWNIEGSTAVNIDSNSFYGSILAPSATISNNGTSLINGEIVAQSVNYTGGHELHDESFTSFATVAVPEPTTYALWGVGLCGAAMVMRRKLTASASA